MPSFLDTVGASPDSVDPITGEPKQQFNGPWSAATYGSAFEPGDPDQPAWTKPQPSANIDDMPAAAAPASPAAADPSAMPAPSSTRPIAEESNPSFLTEPGLDMGNDPGQEVGQQSMPQKARQALPGISNAQSGDLDRIQASGATPIAAKNYQRIGGMDAQTWMDRNGVNDAARQAILQRLAAPEAQRPDATGGIVGGQQFAMPGGSFLDYGSAQGIAKQYAQQAAQTQEAAQRDKANAFKLQLAQAPEQARAQAAAAAQTARQQDPMYQTQVQEEQEKLKALQRGNQPQVQPSAAYGDAQTLIGKLDLTNPQHQPVIAALRQIPKDATAIPPQTMQAAGQLLHPAAPAGQQAMAGLSKAGDILSQSQDLQGQLAQITAKITSGHVSPDDQWQMHGQRQAIEQELVRRGADPQSAHLQVRGYLQKAAPSFIQAPPSQGAFGRGVEDLATSGNSLGQILDLPGTIAGLMANSHRQDIEEKQRKASFLNE